MMIICAHPDDETISCGGTIKKFSEQGVDITVVVCTNGNTGIDHTRNFEKNIIKTRKEELNNACNILGVSKVFNLDYNCQELKYSADFMRKLVSLIRDEAPDLIITHTAEEKHEDHKQLSRSVIQAAWKSGENIMPDLGKTHKVKDVWGFECVDVLGDIDFIVDITSFIEIKILALKSYESQINIINDIESLITGINSIRGYQIGTRYGEGFKRISLQPVEIS